MPNSFVIPMDCSPARLLCPWDFPGKNTEVGCHFLLEGIFLIQGLNSHLLLGRQILYPWTTWEVLIKKYFSNKFENTGAFSFFFTGAFSVVIVIRSTDSFSVLIGSDIEYEIMLYNSIKFQNKCLENSPFKVLRSDNSFNYSTALKPQGFLWKSTVVMFQVVLSFSGLLVFLSVLNFIVCSLLWK